MTSVALTKVKSITRATARGDAQLFCDFKFRCLQGAICLSRDAEEGICWFGTELVSYH